MEIDSNSYESRHIIMLAMIATVVTFLQGCRRTEIDYWGNGNIKSEIQYRNGKINGLATWYYEDGKKFYEANYINEKLEGRLTKWYANGHYQMQEHYTNGMLNGKTVHYNERGKKIEEANYVKDTLHGEYRAWYDDMQIKVEGNYYKGMMNGRWLYWNASGSLIGEGNFELGSGMQKKFNPDGSLEGTLTFKNNVKHGREVYYNASGKITREVIYEDGEFVEEIVFDLPED